MYIFFKLEINTNRKTHTKICLGEYGQKRGPLYFLRRDYWCVKKNQGEAAELISSRDIGNRAQSTRGHDTDRDMVEDVAQECLGKETIR